MSDTSLPNYGSSNHYLGDKGKEYFAWQGSGILFKGRINSHKFCNHIKPTDTVIDFGCGGGGLLANLNCEKKIGVEINPSAKSSLEEFSIEHHFDTSTIPDNSVDTVITDHALEHVPNPLPCLTELRRCLKPGGRIIACVPIDNWRHFNRYDSSDLNHHLYTWTALSFGHLLAEAGFSNIESKGRINAWPPKFTVPIYGRLGYPFFRTVTYFYGLLSGKGTEIIAIATK